MKINNVGNLPPFQRELAKSLSLHFGEQRFTANRVANILGMARATAATYLSMMSKAGVVYRIRDGIFSMTPRCASDNIPPKKKVGPKPPAYSDKHDAIAPEPEPILLPDLSGPFTEIRDAVQWLVERGVSMRPIGALYLLDERQRLTEEQIIASVNRRRRRVSHFKSWRSMAAHLPTEIPEPSIAQRMARR